MYKKFALKFKKVKEIVSAEFLTVVHQGDNIAPLLCIIVFQIAMKSLKNRSKETNTNSKIQDFPKYFQKETSKKIERKNTQMKITELPHWISLYVNNISIKCVPAVAICDDFLGMWSTSVFDFFCSDPVYICSPKSEGP